ncbi:hypothetical protein AcV7_003231 [Taiwanofungus camphoratus]|nr:hypothetical protein AcV7_003231 [Antrodia cinnamomea]
MSSKRSRAKSQTSSSPSEPTPKAARTVLLSDFASASPLLCTLPPTCNPPQNRPTPLANTGELEAHYATYHAHVCEEKGCGSVFPDARLLELHQTECHDPLAAVRKDRGEKIFACHLATCPRRFLTPKMRRLHLIQAHGYPKEYFFAVTNKGVGGLLTRWGEGASLIRGQWKARAPVIEVDSEGASESEGASGDESEERELGGTDMEEASENEQAKKINAQGEEHTAAIRQSAASQLGEEQGLDSLDALAGQLDSLSLVPPTIQFGRGAKRGGFPHQGHGHEDIPMTGGLRGRGLVRGQLRARGRGPVHGSPSKSVRGMGGSSTVAENHVRGQGVPRGVLGAAHLRRGTRGFPAPRATMSVGASAARGRGQGGVGGMTPGVVPIRGRGMGSAVNGFRPGRGRGFIHGRGSRARAS